MAASIALARQITRVNINNTKICRLSTVCTDGAFCNASLKRYSDVAPSRSDPEPDVVESHNETLSNAQAHYRYIFPEILPNPDSTRRNKVCEMLERNDMMNRRSVLEIPEFYVGSILAVTASDKYAAGNTSRFVGICIDRGGCGLRAWFILRNVIDDQGIEIMYEMYSPMIREIQMLKLEKRLDESLLYLRDAPNEYSTFDFDMAEVPHVAGDHVPINPLKVKLRSRPWLERYERQDLKGVEDLGLAQKFYDRAKQLATPWEKYDIMKQYRATVTAEDQDEVFRDIHEKQQQIEQARIVRRRRKKLQSNR
ncbi:PREDICTED: 39S ribosomal protein L19, mitochondrial-like [Priapulus caudatus]|uniref:Large ribosomal subunit protein bL19m n=1 Tax=Priapulus caudatus TaxID=37621 RepID=A0ABM1DVY0_PRICU|nr:PREDICTED: 39S ribosomal protein L19, mitochondrial-like [Priapulus caudatus]